MKKLRLRRRPVDSSSLNSNQFITLDLEYSQIASLEHKQFINNNREDSFFQLKRKEASGALRKQIVENKFSKYQKKNKQNYQQKQSQYYIYCPFTSISTEEDLENWNQFILKQQNNIMLTINDYNNILKTMRTTKGVENVLNEMNNSVYNIIYDEDTYYILINFYFNCGFISKSKELFKEYKNSLPVNTTNNEKVIPNRFKTLLYKYGMTKLKMTPDLLYVYQSRNDRDILRQTLLNFLENSEIVEGLKYFQIIRRYQYENINDSSNFSNTLTLLNYSDYVLIMSVLSDASDMKDLINSLIGTGEIIPPKNITQMMEGSFARELCIMQSSKKYEEQVRNNSFLFTTCAYMYMNQILVEEENFDYEYDDNNSRKKPTNEHNIKKLLDGKLKELNDISQEIIDNLIRTYAIVTKYNATSESEDDSANDGGDTRDVTTKATVNYVHFDRIKRRSMRLKHLIAIGSQFSEAYDYFDRMRENGVACEIYGYSTMFTHTLHKVSLTHNLYKNLIYILIFK